MIDQPKKWTTTLSNFLFRNTNWILFLAIFAFFGICSPMFFQLQNLENVIKQASYIGIVAVGMTLVLLNGGIDLSVGSNMYLCAVTAGLAIQIFGLPIWIGLVVCLTIGFLFGSLNAFLITRLKVIPFVATLGTMVAGRGLALWISKSKAVAFPDAVVNIGSVRLFGLVPLPIIIFACSVAGVWILLNRTTLGRQMYAVGNSVDKSVKAGIDTVRVTATTYMLCGFLSALGGFVSIAQMGIVNAGFGKEDEFDAIAAAVLGGTSLYGGVGSVFPGTMLGAILIQTISSGLVISQVDLYIQPLVSAAIIFVAVWIDSMKNRRLEKQNRRLIRVDQIQ